MISEVHNIDCNLFMKELPDKFFDLAIVDPPYGIGQGGKKINSKTFRSDGSRIPKFDKRNGAKIITKEKCYHNNYKDEHPPDEEYFWELNRVSKNMIIWGANHFLDRMPFLLDSPCWIVWDKVNGETDQSDCELAWTSFTTAVRQVTFMWNGFTQGIGTVNGHINQGNKSLCELRIHPNQKPVSLYKWLLKNYAKPGDKIFDSHMGSQSSRIAADEMGFDYWGCELDPDYFRDGCKRFEQYKAQLKLFISSPEL